MKCVCCQSNRVGVGPIRLEGYLYCRNCHYFFKLRRNSEESQQQISVHYDTVDPYERVAKAKEPFFRFALEILPDPGNRNLLLLDVGCGYGYFLEHARRKGWRVKGAEIAEVAVEQSRRKFGKENIIYGSVESANYKNEYFDAVTLWDVLVLTDNPSQVLSECMRILKKGGKIGIRVRNASIQQYLYRMYHPFKSILSKLGIKRPYVFHPNCFTKQSIYSLLSRLGYENIRITPSPLTSGDPYDHARFNGFIHTAKKLISFMAGLFFKVSMEWWILSPSLLVWAEKPRNE